MKKNVSKICVTIASLALTLSGSLVSTQAKTVKAPTIPRKVVVWVDTTSSKFKEAGSDKLAIKNASKSIKLKGNGEIDDNGPLFIPTTNKNFCISYTKAFRYNKFYIVPSMNVKVTNALVGQRGSAKFDIIQNGKTTYHMSTKFVVKKNPGRFSYIKVNGTDILKKFKEDEVGDFDYSMKLAGKKVTINYKDNYPNLHAYMELYNNKGYKKMTLKNNKPFLPKKGGCIGFYITPPTWDREVSYGLVIK